MFSSDGRPECSEYNGCFADQELTPKPLRIAKQRKSRSSNAVTINHLPSLPNPCSHHASTPIRRSSVQSNFTPLDLSHQDPAVPTSQWSRRNTSLHIDKQRRSDPGHTSIAACSYVPDGMAASNSLPSFMGPRSRHTPIIVDTALTSHADESKTVTAARHAGTRAVTTFPFEKTDVQRLKTDIQRFITDEPLIPPAHTPWARTRRRAVTANEGIHKSMESEMGTPCHGQSKQPSTKHRLISRVMSGLTNKAHTSHAASREGSQTMQPPQTDALSSISPVAVTLDVVRRSVSSAGTDDYGGSELDGTLSAFPTPPTATDTSPTSPTTTGFASSSRPVSQQYRSLRKPEDAAVLGVKLTLSPEYDQLSPDNGKSMFLAIDVKGALNTTTSGQNLWSQHSGLDVVMIIDNS